MARFLLWLLGVLNSVADIIPYGQLRMRPLQLFLIAQWSMASQPLCFLVKLNEVFFLGWWENKHNLTYGVPLTSPQTSSTLCTDSSTTGWGTTLDAGDCFRDMDSSRGRGKHKLSRDDGDLSGIEPLLILPLRSDHPDSNRQLDLCIVPKTPGRRQSAPVDLPHHLCMDHNIQLVAVHLAGKLNCLADQLSRATRPVATEWALNSHVFRAITKKWGEPGIDLFATRLNKQLLIYAFDTDALSMDWDLLPFPYLFPPSPIFPVVLQKMKQTDNTFLVIAPLWPHQSWYPNLISLSMDHPLCLPQREDLLVEDLPKRFWVHLNPGLFQYHAWLLSGSTSKQQVFRRALRTELPCLREIPQDTSTMPRGRSLVIGATDGKQILSQLMCP